LREVVNAILFIAGTRCHGESRLPKEFPPYATVQGYWYAWRDEGRWEMINHARSGRQEL
jgi:putative transposase